jgi:hypothetical protein
MEVTDRFPTDAAAREAIADNNSAAAKALAELKVGLDAGHVVVACWTKPQFSNKQSYPVYDVEGLRRVMEGVLNGRCTELRFFHETKQRAPGTNIGTRALFF